MEGCNLCTISQTTHKQTQTVGNCQDSECELLILSDYSKPEDEISGYPLSNRDFKFLWDLLNQIGVKFQVNYVVRCVPIDTNTRRYRKPTEIECQNCIKQNVLSDITRLNPRCVLIMGQSTLDELFNKDNYEVNSLRGRSHTLNLYGVPTKTVTTYHPRYALTTYDRGNNVIYNRFMEDVVYACRHAMTHRSEGLYLSKTITVDQYERIVDIWMNDPSIEYVGYDTESNGLDPLVPGSKITSINF